MTVLFFIFVVLVIFHFVWEGIIAPSLRLELRYDLFEMRDRLRRLKIEHGDNLSDELFSRLQRNINKEIALLHDANIGSLYYAYKKLDEKKNIVTEIEKFDKLVEECPIDDVREIRDKSFFALILAFIVNSGGWLIYVVPVLLCIKSYSTITTLLKKLISLPEADIDKMFPPTTPRPRNA